MIIGVVAVNRVRGIALTNTDEVLEIIRWIDVDGDDCDEPDAVVAIARGEGYWMAIDLRLFGPETIN